MKSRVQELTGLRAIAVTMVVVGHAQRLLAGGYTGLLRPSPFKVFARQTW
jgi:peptidoglycan/LPS O-acetylase OafA/YrhL